MRPLLNKNAETFWSRAPLAGMVASEVAITVSIELLARRAHLSLATILVDRSLLALALLALIVRPPQSQWMPRSPRLALLRVVTGGLTFVGWFGAIGLLSGRVTQAVLLLDALILAYVRGERRPYERRTLLVLAIALILFAAQAVREPGTVLNAGRGIIFLLIALGSRAATYKVWERAQGKQEHLFWLIAPALVGGALGGLFLAISTHTTLQTLSPQMWCVMFAVAMVGLTGYFYMNTVMSLLGAFYTRVVELWQVPMLWAIHLLTDHAHIDWLQGALGTLVACASAYTYLRHRRGA
jgi:drug/metabolite transporter (DMT)-like permease